MKFKSTVDVKLIQQMGGDHMVVAAAKVSTNGTEALEYAEPVLAENNAGLINYLMKHRHGTPFEHSALTFFVHAPIFVWREWHRHRVGFCLAGDTEIWSESYCSSGRTLRKLILSDLYDRWTNGVCDSLGRVRRLESIRQQKLRVLNEDTGVFELGGIVDVIQSGVKECYLVEVDHPKEYRVKCSGDHPVLTEDGWVKTKNLTGREYIAVSGKRSVTDTRTIPPSLRRGIGVWTSMKRKELIERRDNCYICGKLKSRKFLQLDHVIPVALNLRMALSEKNLKPICKKCHKIKTNGEQKLAVRQISAGSKFVKLLRKPFKVSEEMTYDIVMEGPWHNFVANGIVVHNSYNEESARYKTLDPVFYIPAEDRPMMKVDDWKPGRPKFTLANRETVGDVCAELMESYRLSYDAYLRLLSLNIDPGLARDCLPVGIYSGCWVTCNPRSLMHFLSLRTHDEMAKQVSYPLYEIELGARACEEILAKGWPITYEAFVKNGRVAP